MQLAQPIARLRLRRFGVLAERTAWTFGTVCLVTCGALYFDGAAGARQLERFAILQATVLRQPPALDVSVLDPTPTRSLTLVTCYPFYHVGPAPQRYIVRAVRADTTTVQRAS